MRPLPIEPVAGVPEYIEGLAVIRGVPRPVIDAARLLTGHPGTPTRFVVLRTDGGRVALAVEAVLAVSAIPHRLLHDLPRIAGEEAEGALERVAAWDGGLVLVLRAARLVPEHVWPVLSARGAS